MGGRQMDVQSGQNELIHSCNMCENPFNMSMMNVRLAKLQTYVIFRVMDRVQSQHVWITDILQ